MIGETELWKIVGIWSTLYFLWYMPSEQPYLSYIQLQHCDYFLYIITDDCS